MSQLLERWNGKVITVEEIVVHYSPDLDVLLAIALIILFGKKVFRGFDGKLPKVTFVGAGNSVEAKPNVLVLDTGGVFDPEKLLLDHHGISGSVCTLDIIAKMIGMENHPKLQLLLKVIREHDLSGKDVYPVSVQDHAVNAILSIKTVVDGFFSRGARRGELNGATDSQDMFWLLVRLMMAVIKAVMNFDQFKADGEWRKELERTYAVFLWKRHIGSMKNFPATLPFLRIIEVMDKELRRKTSGDLTLAGETRDSKIFRLLTGQVPLFQQNGQWQAEAALFSVCGIAFGMQFTGLDFNQRLSTLGECLAQLDSMDFDWIEACSHFADLNSSLLFGVVNNGRRFLTRVAAIRSNCISASRAVRYSSNQLNLRAGIVVCFRTYGQIQISVLKNKLLQELLYKIGLTLRIAECIVQFRSYSLADIKDVGMNWLVPQWFIAGYEDFLTQASLVSNGTLKNQDAPPTKLTMATILMLIQNVAFFGEVPSHGVIQAIVRDGQEQNGWPESSKHPQRFSDLRKKHGGDNK
ncbi:hypothetical protein KKF32_00710 [Patescibacteria group bacterium]|nr:hypothetical protein [Patescibacteria group bacterium]